MLENLFQLWQTTGIYKMIYTIGEQATTFNPEFYKTLIMYVIVGVLMYLAIGKGFEPLLLLPIAFGMLLANLPAQSCSIKNGSSTRKASSIGGDRPAWRSYGLSVPRR